MKIFQYIARDASGKQTEGQHKANTRQEVQVWLRSQGHTPMTIKELKSGSAAKSAGIKHKRVKSIELSDFCWQLATMLEGGVPLIDAVETICDDIDNLTLRITLNKVVKQMQGGKAFAESLADHPGVFDALFCSLVLAGESGGALTTTLQRLGDHFAEKDKLARKVKGAMSYPIFVVVFIFLILVAVMTFIIPRFRTIFDQIDGELPIFTKIFITVYDNIMANSIYGIVIVVSIIVFCGVWNKTDKGRRQFSQLILSIPMIGKIIRQSFYVVFCRTLSTLLVNGVSVLDAFHILSGMTKNTVIQDAVSGTRENIIEGSSISNSMAHTGFFPNMAIKMAQVGEESGSMPKVLDRTGDHFERKVEGTITAMTSLLEPILIVSVGAIVLVVVLALYLPIFSISDI